MPISAVPSVVEPAHKKRSARVDDTIISPFTSTNPPDNALGSWRTHRSSSRRKKVEALFAELKNQIGLRRLRLRRMKFVREQFFLAAAAQNIKRLVRFLSRPGTPCSARHDLATEKNSAGQATKAKTSQVQRVFQHPQVAVEKLIR
jgi:hypothetical protein